MFNGTFEYAFVEAHCKWVYIIYIMVRNCIVIIGGGGKFLRSITDGKETLKMYMTKAELKYMQKEMIIESLYLNNELACFQL